MAVIWSIWNQRNNLLFKSNVIDMVKIFAVAQMKT